MAVSACGTANAVCNSTPVRTAVLPPYFPRDRSCSPSSRSVPPASIQSHPDNTHSVYQIPVGNPNKRSDIATRKGSAAGALVIAHGRAVITRLARGGTRRFSGQVLEQAGRTWQRCVGKRCAVVAGETYVDM